MFNTNHINIDKKRFIVLCGLGFVVGITFLFYFQPYLVQHRKSVITIGVIGDILFHKENQIQAFSKGSYSSIWNHVAHHFQQFDIVFANYEGVSANVIRLPNGSCSVVNEYKSEYGHIFRSWEIYKYKPNTPNIFNYHTMLARDLKQSGIGLVSIANNHILDLCNVGLIQTMKGLKFAELPFIGGRMNSSEEWYEITTIRGYDIAWIGCTVFTNWHDDETDNLLYCNNPIFLKLISKLNRLYEVVVTIHGGKENSYGPGKSTQRLVFNALQEGAMLVICNHPHVAQPVEVFKIHNRRTAVIWSVGNFISHQGYGLIPVHFNKSRTNVPSVRKRSSGIIKFQFKPFENGLEFDCFDYVPTCVECVKTKEDYEYFVRDVREADCENEGRWLRNVWGDWGACRALEENLMLALKWRAMKSPTKPAPKLQGNGKCLRDVNVFNYVSQTFE